MCGQGRKHDNLCRVIHCSQTYHRESKLYIDLAAADAERSLVRQSDMWVQIQVPGIIDCQ